MARAFRREEILTSDIPTNRLLALALTLPVDRDYSELHGRSHAFYSIAVTQVKAVEYVLDNLGGDNVSPRTIAAEALAMAGYTLAQLYAALHGDMARAERGGRDV